MSSGPRIPEGKPGKFSTRESKSVSRFLSRERTRARLTIGCRCELTAGCEAVGHESLKENGSEVSTTQVDGGGVASRA